MRTVVAGVLWGGVDQIAWNSTVAGLYVEGPVQIIAHFKVARMQFTLVHDTNVLPRAGAL